MALEVEGEPTALERIWPALRDPTTSLVHGEFPGYCDTPVGEEEYGPDGVSIVPLLNELLAVFAPFATDYLLAYWKGNAVCDELVALLEAKSVESGFQTFAFAPMSEGAIQILEHFFHRDFHHSPLFEFALRSDAEPILHMLDHLSEFEIYRSDPIQLQELLNRLRQTYGEHLTLIQRLGNSE